MSIACVAVPRFALRVALLHRPDLDGAPLVLGPPPGARPVVLDATPEAAAHGIRPGLNLREVAALCPEAVAVVPHPVREAAATERLETGDEPLSPAVEADADPGVYYVDPRGAERLLGPPALAAEELLATVPPPLRPRLGVAPNPFAARVAARNAPPGGIRSVAPEAVATFLAPVPVALLLLPPRTSAAASGWGSAPWATWPPSPCRRRRPASAPRGAGCGSRRTAATTAG